MTGILHFYAMRNALYHLCLRSERDESRPYGSRPVVYNMGNHVLGGCQRVAMRQRSYYVCNGSRPAHLSMALGRFPTSRRGAPLRGVFRYRLLK